MERRHVLRSMRVMLLAGTLLGSSAQAGIVINEIMNNPAAVSDRRGEWFELFNTTAEEIDLFGWSLRDGGRDSLGIDTPLTIAPGSFLVFARNADPAQNGGLAADYVYGSSLVLGNGVDELILLNARGAVADAVRWDNGVTFPDASGASMALLDPALDNALGASWTTTPPELVYGLGDRGTPGKANAPVTTIPAPSTGILLGIGAVGMGAAFRSGRRRHT